MFLKKQLIDTFGSKGNYYLNAFLRRFEADLDKISVKSFVDNAQG